MILLKPVNVSPHLQLQVQTCFQSVVLCLRTTENDLKRCNDKIKNLILSSLFKVIRVLCHFDEIKILYTANHSNSVSYGDKIPPYSSQKYCMSHSQMFKYYFQSHFQSPYNYESSRVDTGSPYTSSVLAWPSISKHF